VDVLKPAAKETIRADIQTSCRLAESDLGAQQVGDPVTRLHRVLYLLWERYGRSHAADIAAGNLTVSQLSILTTLIDQGPARMSDLAASERVRAPTARGAILRLLRLGLVTRRRDWSDQRVVRIDITARGRSVQHKAAAARKQRIAAGLAQLNRQDREALRRALPLLELIAQTAHSHRLPS
jgi:DNA-binding MarR family transcriptional regulator